MSKYLFSILLCFSILRATPPDILTSEIVFLGGSSEKAVFLVKTGFNMGSHYLWENRWYYLSIDLSEFTFEYIFQGSIINASEDYGGVRYSPNAESMSIPQVLQYWEVNDIDFHMGSSNPLWEEAGMNYSIRDNSFCIDGEDDVVFPGVRCFDPGYLAIWNTEFEEYFLYDGECPVKELDLSVEIEALTVDAGVQLGDTYLLIGHLLCEMSSRDVVLYIPSFLDQ